MHHYCPAEHRYIQTNVNRGRGTGGGGIGDKRPSTLHLRKKCPFLGMKVPYFHGIEVSFLLNLSALFGQCPLTFEVLPRSLYRKYIFIKKVPFIKQLPPLPFHPSGVPGHTKQFFMQFATQNFVSKIEKTSKFPPVLS